jgi:outer membrane protein assembly factor BamB
MRVAHTRFFFVLVLAGCALLALGAGPGAADWPEWRGPARDGISAETELPTEWSPAGHNLAWKVPYGGRSTPVVFGNRLYLQNGAGEGAERQERVMALEAESGRMLWEHRVNLYQSDVPPHRIGWASPAVDPRTGNVYVFSGAATLLGLSSEGAVLWERHLQEEFGMVTTHGGRTVSPVVDGDLVIVSGAAGGWGAQARGSHRFFAFDRTTGEVVWVSSPAGQNFDTTYSPPLVAEIDGGRAIIAGAGDGAVHALKVATGEPIWRFPMSKRGINNGAVLSGTTAIVSHSEENLDTSEMGMLAAIDAAAAGEIGPGQIRWRVTGFLSGFPSPVLDGDRVYVLDNFANLAAFDVASGRRLWLENLGTIQRASPVLADGRLHVGTENGRFYILKPGPDRCEIVHQVQLGTEAQPEEIKASVAIADGRIYLVTDAALYAIGTRKPAARPETTSPAPPTDRPDSGTPAFVQVLPTEIIAEPGQEVRFRARLFDAAGRFLREERAAWSVEGLQVRVGADGTLAIPAEARGQAGEVRATVGDVAGTARVRVIPPLPATYDFEGMADGSVPSYWISAAAKFAVREVDGNRVLVKLADPRPFIKRTRAYIGSSDLSDYTIETDVLAIDRRRQMGDGGVVAQRYSLILFGNHQRLELQAWQPETERTVVVPFEWKGGEWYRMKLRVESLPEGRTRARGKVWPRDGAEPEAWTIERIDPIGNRRGAPAIYGDAPNELYFDNIRVMPNAAS